MGDVDLRYLTREFLLDFIELYKQRPCLWLVKSPDYTNRLKKHEAYKVLIKKLKEVDPDANRNTVIKKINTFRGSFRKEFRKVKASVKADPDNVHQPKLWYYNSLLFLLDNHPPGSLPPNLDTEVDISYKIEVIKITAFFDYIFTVIYCSTVQFSGLWFTVVAAVLPA